MQNKRKINKKNKLIISIIIVAIILLITTFVCYKIFLLNKYDVKKLETANYDTFLKAYKERETITVNHIAVKNNNYLTYKNIKIKNVYKDYSIDDELSFGSMVTYKKKDASGNTIDVFKMSINKTYVDVFGAKGKNFITSIDSDISSAPLEADIADYIKENNISNDLDMFKLLSTTRNYKPNIFTGTEKIKDHYGAHLIGSIILPKIDKFTIINGEHIGYMLSINNYTEVNVLKDNQKYTLFFMDKNDEEVIEQLNTLIIK